MFVLLVAVASAAVIPVLDVDRAYPYRDEFDRPIATIGQKIAFDVRTKAARTEQDVPVVPAVAYHAPALTYAAAPVAYAAAPYAFGYQAPVVRYI